MLTRTFLTITDEGAGRFAPLRRRGNAETSPGGNYRVQQLKPS